MFESIDNLRLAVGEVLPSASIEQDNEGQILIYTGLTVDDDGSVVLVEEEDTPCDICGVYPGDPHNGEAHLAEMRADQYAQYEYAMDPYEDYSYADDEEISEDRCFEVNRHHQNWSGHRIAFGPNADVLADNKATCDDCFMDLSCDWVPKGYNVIRDFMVVMIENRTAAGRLISWSTDAMFPVYEKVSA